MPENKQNEFVTLQAAAAKTGWSVATLYRLIRNRRIASITVPMHGRKPETRVSLPDVQALGAPKPSTAVAAPTTAVAAPTTAVAAPTKAVAGQLRDITAALLEAARTLRPAEPMLTLSVREAAALSGLSPRTIRGAVQDARLRVLPGRGYRISRASLVEYCSAGAYATLTCPDCGADGDK